MSFDALTQANSLTQAQTSTSGQSSLGKDEFLTLMIKQMQQQDPLNPMDNQAMVAQMAQFSSVEQMSNLNDNFSNANTIAQFMDSTSLLGKEVAILDPGSSPDSPQVLESKVLSVSFTNTGPLLTLENGMNATVEDLMRVGEPTEL